MNYTKDEIIVLSISLAVIILLSWLISFLLKNKSEKVRRIPFIVITAVLLILEVVKQIKGIKEGYSMWTFPLHFCSTYFVWFSLANFTKGKFSECMKTVAFVASFYLFALFYVNPVSIIGDACKNLFESFSNFHTFFFHHLVIFYFVLSLFMKEWDMKLKHSIAWVVSMFIYYCLAVLVGNVYDVNYMNVLYSNIPFMENLRLAIGQLGYNIILGALTVGVGALIIVIVSIIEKKYYEKKSKKI